MVLGTLVLQGLTLRPLLLRLRLEDDGAVDREVRLARVETLRAALAAAAAWPRAETAAARPAQLRAAAAPRGGGTARGAARAAADAATAGTPTRTVVRAATAAQRRRLVALRADGTIGDAAFQRVEEELDWAELGWAQVLPPEPRAGREA